MFALPDGVQSVPRAMRTPALAIALTGAVKPYKSMFERGDQMTEVPVDAIFEMSAGLRPIAWMSAVFGSRTSSWDGSSPSSQSNSFSAVSAMPSATCGR
jgi:hypothetical protein